MMTCIPIELDQFTFNSSEIDVVFADGSYLILKQIVQLFALCWAHHLIIVSEIWFSWGLADGETHHLLTIWTNQVRFAWSLALITQILQLLILLKLIYVRLFSSLKSRVSIFVIKELHLLLLFYWLRCITYLCKYLHIRSNSLSRLAMIQGISLELNSLLVPSWLSQNSLGRLVVLYKAVGKGSVLRVAKFLIIIYLHNRLITGNWHSCALIQVFNQDS